MPTFSNIPSRKNLSFLFNIKSMAWTCSKCTFINPPSQKSACQICLSAQASSSSASLSSKSSLTSSWSPPKPKWSCKACTFLNSYQNNTCEICGTRVSSHMLSSLENDELYSSVGTVFLPLQPCKRKVGENPLEVVDDVDHDGFRNAKAGRHKEVLSSDLLVECMADETYSGTEFRKWKILSYNVWFREDLEMHRRMKALGDLIQLHSPDVICLQEVTPNIYGIFVQSSWWKLYNCSVSNDMAFTRPYFCMQLSKLPVKCYSCKPFRNSIMGRELCAAEVEVEKGMPLVVATSHLESPCPAPPKWDQMYSKERIEQAKEALNFLKENPNVIFCGDMNWDDKLDGQFPLPDGWIDAWVQLRPGENGWTYDTKTNKMLTGNRTLQRRLDRFIYSLHDFEISEIDMIGMDAIPGLSYCKEKKVKKEVQKLELPVLPSDHYGLLLTICSCKRQVN